MFFWALLYGDIVVKLWPLNTCSRSVQCHSNVVMNTAHANGSLRTLFETIPEACIEHLLFPFISSCLVLYLRPTAHCTENERLHYGNVIMGTMASQITSLVIVYSTVYWGADQRKHQSSASLAFVRGIHRGPVNSPHKWQVTRMTLSWFITRKLK